MARQPPTAFHPSNWRTPKAIPAHAPKLSATADQQTIVERQSIDFMASPLQAPNAILFDQTAKVSAVTKASRHAFPQLIPAFHRALIVRRAIRCAPPEHSDGTVDHRVSACDRSTEPVGISVDDPRSRERERAEMLHHKTFA